MPEWTHYYALHIALGLAAMWGVWITGKISAIQRRVRSIEDRDKKFYQPLTADNPYRSPTN